jgi:hypothetical protein
VDIEQKVQTPSVKAHTKMTNVDRLIQHITEAPAIMKMRDPTAKRKLSQHDTHISGKHVATHLVLYL